MLWYAFGFALIVGIVVGGSSPPPLGEQIAAGAITTLVFGVMVAGALWRYGKTFGRGD